MVTRQRRVLRPGPWAWGAGVLLVLLLLPALLLQDAAAASGKGGSALTTRGGYKQALKDGEELDIYVYMSNI